jgi:hypothetical protein
LIASDLRKTALGARCGTDVDRVSSLDSRRAALYATK